MSELDPQREIGATPDGGGSAARHAGATSVRRGVWFTLAAVLLLVAAALPARAERAPADDPALLCDAAAARAARETGVPLDVLRAIALTETGKRRDGALRPWPWTVNMEGKGVWFDSETAARDYVARHHARGARSYDVGCFQLNYRWHGKAFGSPQAMFDPLAGARYAARFLADLYAETGDWSRAAGAYHSRTPHFAQRYRKRFDTLYARISGQPMPEGATAAPDLSGDRVAMAGTGDAGATPVESARPQRENRFPLLVRAGASGAMGSLVPLGAAAPRPLFGPAAAPAENSDAG